MTSDSQRIYTQYVQVINASRRQALWPIAIIFLGIGYLIYSGFALGVHDKLANIRIDRGMILATDTFAHKYHVIKRFKKDQYEINLEGTRDHDLTTNLPEWIKLEDEVLDVDLGDSYRVSVSGNEMLLSGPDFADIRVIRNENGVELESSEPLPKWARFKPKKFEARPELFKRVQMTKTKIEIHRYFVGWENFWFEFGSPFNGLSFTELAKLVVSGERVDPQQSNFDNMVNSFWHNKEWQHKDVYRALLETVIMALLGTFVASVIALPLAFMAAANFNRDIVSRMLIRRIFDFLRGIDTLIWSLIFIRAFGLGPLTGIMAIVFTMVGELGKLYSEAIENISDRQVEGVQSTGANNRQKYIFGVLPQIMPVVISQTLYYLESNTRSATIIGALGAGGIGLMLVQTIQTSKDWENTLYLIILTLIVVILMDMLSGWLRRKLL